MAVRLEGVRGVRRSPVRGALPAVLGRLEEALILSLPRA